MIWPFKCRHPAAFLAVEKGQTVRTLDADFELVTYHLRCVLCSAPVTVEHVELIGGVSAFLARKPSV